MEPMAMQNELIFEIAETSKGTYAYDSLKNPKKYIKSSGKRSSHEKHFFQPKFFEKLSLCHFWSKIR